METTLHKKILCLITLPRTPEFEKHSGDVDYFLGQMESEGATVSREISKETLSVANEYDVIIVIAHLDETDSKLMLSDTVLDIAELVEYIPQDFSGIFDFSSCNSAQWSGLVKARCPKCKIQCSLQQVSLQFRMNVYPDIIHLFVNEEAMDYYQAYDSVLDVINEGTISVRGQERNEETTKLGNPESIVYAPSSVSPGDTFMVQLFLKDDNTNSKQITLKAKKRDPFTGHIETEELPVALEVGDTVDVGYSIFASSKEYFEIDSENKRGKWNGHCIDFQFNVLIKEGILQTSFINKIIIEVNHNPVAECSFRTIISKTDDRTPTVVDIHSRDSCSDGEKGRVILQKKLTDTLSELQKKYENVVEGDSREKVLRSINTCRLCLELVEKPIVSEPRTRPKKVFVSSTCEEFMKPFRDAVRNVILSLKMEPEMCDEWPQSGCNPAHVCCRKVLDSDIYLGVFGGRYGYIEPSLESSMTQVEYMTALSARKKILVFIIDPVNSTDEPEMKRKRQRDFIEELKHSRILRTFTSVPDLVELTKNDLLDIIANI